MILLIGEVIRVSDPIQKTDDKTGEISNVWQVQILHNKTDAANSEIVIQNLKAKSAAQSEAFRKCLNKQIRVPVGLYAFDSEPGLWIEKGVMPTPISEAKAA